MKSIWNSDVSVFNEGFIGTQPRSFISVSSVAALRDPAAEARWPAMASIYFIENFCLPLVLSSKDRQKSSSGGFPGGAVVKNPPANAGDTGSSPGPERSHMLRSN